MSILPDNTVVALISGFYHGFTFMKDAIVGGVFGSIWQSITAVTHGNIVAVVTLPGLLFIAWKIKTWMPMYIFKKLL